MMLSDVTKQNGGDFVQGGIGRDGVSYMIAFINLKKGKGEVYSMYCNTNETICV